MLKLAVDADRASMTKESHTKTLTSRQPSNIRALPSKETSHSNKSVAQYTRSPSHEDVAYNDFFPIHVDMMDSHANLQNKAGGGVFMHHLYDPKNQEMVELTMLEEEAAVKLSGTAPRQGEEVMNMMLNKESTA